MNKITSTTILFFLLMDSIGNLPIFISILKHLEQKYRKIIIIREMLIALFIMLIFLLIGDHILSFLNIRMETVSISGGIILFLIAIKMLFPPKEANSYEKILSSSEEPFLVPLAIPLVAGPSILGTLMLLAHQYPQQINQLAWALIIAWSLSVIVLMLSNVVLRLLGNKGLSALERLIGLLLIMLSIQMLLDGIKVYLNT
ncbi:YhgN family NAAT transporter [Candidatus Curculioniphilus buchneri]|uniref:YhgN family NAAT transporter n=1 Tax=Candidatus Curculioniphilus buchneri TaxID=690594 RepID=UPI00376EA711